MSLPDATSAIQLSVWVGLWCTVLGLPPAVVVGFWLARRDFPGKAIVSTLVLLPLVLPPVVTGLLLLEFFGRHGPVGRALATVGLEIPFTLAGAVVAAGAMGFPLLVLAIRSAFESVDPRYEELAWTLGVPPRQTFWRVSLPLALPGVAAGAVLAFGRALGEFGATAVIAGNIEGRTRTIALAVYTLLETPGGEPTLWLLVGASALASLIALIAYEGLGRWQRRRLDLPTRGRNRG